MGKSKGDYQAEADELGVEYDDDTTVAELRELIAEAQGDGDGRRAHSIVPESELHHLEGQGVKLSALPKAKSGLYDVYANTDEDGEVSFEVVPHEGGDE